MVKNSCDSTAIANVTSAGSATATASGGASSETGSSGAGKNKEEPESRANIVTIAGGISGVVAIAALSIGLFLFIRRKRLRETRGEEIPSHSGGPPDYTGKPELMGNSEFMPHNAGAGKGYFSPPAVSEISTGAASPKPELDGGKPIVELPPNHSKGYPSPYGQPSPQASYVSPITSQHGQNAGWAYSPNGQPVYEFPSSPAPAQRPGIGHKSGPVEAYEMGANVGKWAK
ncbi:hypothetical protein FZEAL_8682 [Fusarium zealandicum]|uniref:Uncharacterized protein n=1 Tax=Fusarium zealandicum TaxID=1053134 RepID=A0A8H4XGM0_9HYPO|nr:hypothetical protein FZEAL_8682 [Fusarium zealandicum]